MAMGTRWSRRVLPVVLIGAVVAGCSSMRAAGPGGLVVPGAKPKGVAAVTVDPAALAEVRATRQEHLAARQMGVAQEAELRRQTEADEEAGRAPALPVVEPLMPLPGDVPVLWQPLDKTVRAIAADFPGRLSVTAIDLKTGARYDFRPRDRYYPASTFKLPVTICTVQAIQRGELKWDTMVTFTPEDDDTVGQGGFATTPYGTLWPVRNLLDRSIISSNNVAVKMLARTLTWDGLLDCTTRLGGPVTRTEDGSTPVTAPDEAAWWMAIWNMKQQQPAVAEDLLRPLRAVTYTGRIQAGTPRSDLVTHKFGTYPPYENDGAIIWGDRPYILVVMSYGGDHLSVDGTIADIATAAWNAEYARK